MSRSLGSLNRTVYPSVFEFPQAEVSNRVPRLVWPVDREISLNIRDLAAFRSGHLHPRGLWKDLLHENTTHEVRYFPVHWVIPDDRRIRFACRTLLTCTT